MNQIIPLIRVFSYLSILTVGGGLAAFPELKQLTVNVHGWLTFTQLIHLYSMGQVAPGPNMMMIVAIGDWAAGIAGSGGGRHRVFRADRAAGVLCGTPLDQAGEMAVAKLHPAWTHAGFYRIAAGRMFEPGQGSGDRMGHIGNCSRSARNIIAFQD